jgi:hypothetical protein
MIKLASFFIVLLMVCSCKTQELYLNVVEPAPVSLPPYIKSIGIIDRSTPSDALKKVDAIDKVLSLEGKNLDRDGANSAIGGMTDELMKNNRFSEIKPLPMVDFKGLVSGIFPPPLDWDAVAKVCTDNKLDALFSLEMFDTDTKISYLAKPINTKSVLSAIATTMSQQADMLTVVKTGWRIYDPGGKAIIDEFVLSRNITFSATGLTPVIAASALIDRKEAVKRVANQAGQAYASRILPYEIRVTRDYYVKGTDNFKMAMRKARTGNWDQAGELWKKETENPKRKIAGRACYNMAIISEINGNLDVAVEWAQKSYEDYNNKLALRYIDILNYRKNNNRILQDQQEK